MTTPSKAAQRMVPAPSPDGTTQGLSGAQTGGLGNALRALTIDGVRRDGTGPLWGLADRADRLERERDEARAQVDRVCALVLPLAEGGPTDDETLTVGQVRAALDPEADRS
jgi:hypothetical protein